MIRRCFKFAGATVVAGGVAVLAPPIESLPAPLVHYRVTCEGLGRLSRCVYVGLQTLYLFKLQLPATATPAEEEAAHKLTAERLTHLAEVNGGMYIKTGQAFASMNHLLPPTYCKIMNKLHDAVLNRPLGEIYYVLEEEYGKPISEVFERFDEKAVAAASLAQVHRAKLRETGEEVAVKVQYIDIAQRYQGDFATIVLMLGLAGKLFPGYDFGKLVRASNDTLQAELDFEQEANNLERCHEDLVKEFTSGNVVCPKLHRKHCTKRVMVTSFVDGVKADDAEGMKRLGLDPHQVGSLLSDAFAYQLFKSRFVHADPHPGNILVRANPVSGAKGDAQCVILDHGLSFSLTEHESRDLAEIWTCCATHDDANLKKIMRKLGLSDGGDGYKIFGSMWLQYPYDFFDPSRKQATQEHLDVMREGANRSMPVVTDMLEKLPTTYALALRNINTYRSVHKKMGNPVSRCARMLRYSIVSARSEHISWFDMQHALFSLWWNEFYMKWSLAFVKWWYPELTKDNAEMDDMLTVG